MKSKGKKTLASVVRCIAANLDDPTHDMRFAFRRLSQAHKLILFALVDADDAPLAEQNSRLLFLFVALDPSSEESDVDQLLRELSEGFLRVEITRDYDDKKY